MSQWANEHPEEMAEIAALPLGQQNAALREAMGYDPDRIRERTQGASGCTNCGAAPYATCADWCIREQRG